MSVADFMNLALNHPDHGYYHSRHPFGPDGDFVTAPDVSQAFGELIGLWLASAWQEAGRPAPFRLVELGPGRGQLMADLLRATAKIPGFHDAADLHLVETSKRLRDMQKERLIGLDIAWHGALDTVPIGPLFLVANEFFDALPVHQFLRTDTGWAERLVTSDEAGLAFVQGEVQAAQAGTFASLADTEPGQIAELSLARETLCLHIGERIRRDGGIATVIDYGAWADRATGDTLQAVKSHRSTDPLSTPGEIDLTTQVDFRRLGHAAAEGGADIFGPVPQGTFLRTLGIEIRTATLLKRADAIQRKSLRGGLFRLTDASAMGEAFKVLVLGAPGGPPPPGFGEPSLRSRRP